MQIQLVRAIVFGEKKTFCRVTSALPLSQKMVPNLYIPMMLQQANQAKALRAVIENYFDQ